MFNSNFRPVVSTWNRLAVVASLSALGLSSALAQSASEKTLQPVFVSASRFASDPAFAPIGATVISAEEIRASGAGNVNEAVRKLGGVYGRQSTNGSQDFLLDLRGFGSTGNQNLVVMVDGIRMSENELAVALLSSIPVESVERIEIVRGGSSVLFGEGATGGSIQIITKRPQKNSMRGSVLAEVGNYGHREMRAGVARGWDEVSMDINASTQRADNYRANNKLEQDNLSAGVQWADKQSRLGARVELARQDSRLAGALTLAQFNANPRQTLTPNDFGAIDTNRYTLVGEHRIGALELAAELSRRERKSQGTFVSAFGTYFSNADSNVTQFSPRLRYLTTSADWTNELVSGIDFSRWERKTLASFGGFPSANADASQKSRALYLRNEIRAGQARVALGARRESFDKNFTDPLAFSTKAYVKTNTLNAWELQGSYALLQTLDVFAKVGKSYRMANADENGATPVINQPLAPQTSRDAELGFSLGDVQRKVTMKLFQHRLHNEIFYNPTVFANVNLDSTKRQGVEIEGAAQLASSLRLIANLQHVAAEFTGGVNAGREMVLVPRNTAALRLDWQPGAAHSVNVGVQWADAQRYGGDFNNACAARIPSYATLDGRYAYRTGAWEFALAGNNLADRQFFSTAYGACQTGIYPDMGRQIKASARLSF